MHAKTTTSHYRSSMAPAVGSPRRREGRRHAGPGGGLPPPDAGVRTYGLGGPRTANRDSLADPPMGGSSHARAPRNAAIVSRRGTHPRARTHPPGMAARARALLSGVAPAMAFAAALTGGAALGGRAAEPRAHEIPMRSRDEHDDEVRPSSQRPPASPPLSATSAPPSARSSSYTSGERARAPAPLLLLPPHTQLHLERVCELLR